MDKTGESDFSPGQIKGTTSLLPPSTTKKRGFFSSRPKSSSGSRSASATSMSASTNTSLLVASPSPTSTPSPVAIPGQPGSTLTSSTPSTSPPLAVEENSGSSEDDQEEARDNGGESGGGGGESFPLRRKVSMNANKERNTTSLKEGYLMKQTSSFQRWHKRYFKIKGKRLLYAKDEKSQIFEEVDISEVTIAESSSKSCKNSFQVITPHRTLHLGTEKRSDMIDWANTIRSASDLAMHPIDLENLYMLYGSHHWAVVSHSLPTYCNVCREQLCVTSTALSCEVCRLKSHKRCALLATMECKWTSLSTMEKVAFTESDKDGDLLMPHQWVEGNLPMGSKCRACAKGCGSILRLQDWQCLWCDATAHNVCRGRVPRSCRPQLLSTVPPWALTHVGVDSAWDPPPPLRGCSPLLVFVNSKSGNNQGLTLLIRFKQLLNPAQVFDLVTDGPTLGLQLFKHFEPFRILVCGGDGSVGWVMAEVDRLNLHKQCQIGILPLGTGNDLARVLGWGASFADDAHLFNVLLKYERATTKMLDRWGVMTFERDSSSRLSFLKDTLTDPSEEQQQRDQEVRSLNLLAECEQSVVTQLRAIILDPSPTCQNHEDAIDSGKQLCEAVKKLIANISSNTTTVDPEIEANCSTMTEKLNILVETLENFREETTNNIQPADNGTGGKTVTSTKHDLLQRANSLEKALSRVMESRQNGHLEKHGVVGDLLPPVKRPLEYTGSNVAGRNNRWTSHDITSTDIPGGCFNRRAKRAFSYKHAITQSSSRDEGEDDDEVDICEELEVLHRQSNMHPTIEIESPSSSSSPLKTQNDYDLSETDIDIDISLGMEPDGSNSNITALEDESPSPDVGVGTAVAGGSGTLVVPPGSLVPNLPRGISPRASRRVSTGSLLKPLELDSGECSPIGGCSSSSSATSAPPSPHKKGHRGRGGKALVGKKKKLPIVNPQLSEPGWSDASLGGSGLGNGGFIGRALIQNVDTICAVASPLMDMEENQELCSVGFKERCVMNNYFGIGIDAKITLAFHLKREEHPELCGSRIRNFVWYGILGGREFLLKSCRNLEQRIILECDGQRIFLPSLQGIVILNIQSFMGGTNFWGGLEADDSFLAPSFDDRVLEVVAIYDVMQMAASRLVHLQHHRIAQCQSVKITILGDDPLPVQVDGEAWLQAPGAIQIVHKNRVQMLCRNRELEFSLKAWDKLCEQQTNGTSQEKKGKGQKKRQNNNRRLKSGSRSSGRPVSGDGPSSPSTPPSSGGERSTDLVLPHSDEGHERVRKNVETFTLV